MAVEAAAKAEDSNINLNSKSKNTSSLSSILNSSTSTRGKSSSNQGNSSISSSGKATEVEYTLTGIYRHIIHIGVIHEYLSVWKKGAFLQGMQGNYHLCP